MSYYIIFIIIISIISYIHSDCILGTIASKSSECLKDTSYDEYCCFISPLRDESLPSICYPYKKEKYYGNLNINYNKQLYAIDCGIGSSYMDPDWNMTLEDRYSCGKDNPNDYKDCTDDSTHENSCCFYEGYDLKRCYWLGIKYTGKAYDNGYKFICLANYFFNSLFLNVIIIFLLYIS